MADKSRRRSVSKKPGTSVKDKRTERKADATARVERLATDKEN